MSSSVVTEKSAGEIISTGRTGKRRIWQGTLIAELMQYMAHTEGENPHFSKLSNRVRIFKESKEGVEDMCEIMERERMEGRLEGRIEDKIDLVQKKLNKHKGLEQIADKMEETVEDMQDFNGK